MAVYFCKHHVRRDTLAEAKYCNGDCADNPVTSPMPATSPPGHRRTTPSTQRKVYVYRNPNGPPSDPMIRLVARLGGDVEEASSLTMQECGDYIDRLKNPDTATVSMAVAAPNQQPPLLVPLDLLDLVRDGRYAVRPDESHSWTFFRITRPTRGQWAGTLKIQTQHSDSYKLAMVVGVDGKIRWYQDQSFVEANLLLVIADQEWAAVNYSIEKKHCCRCGKELTHEDSTKYGIGPECVTHWPHIPARVEMARLERAGR